MSRTFSILINMLFLITLFVNSSYLHANDQLPKRSTRTNTSASKPFVIPSPPTLNAKAYILIDVNSGKILSEKNSEEKLPPASLTKLMTLYVISNALQHQQVSLEDKVRISKKAWKTGGSRMFVKEGDYVSVESLLKGIIVDSGNDACVAMAEHLSGGEESFTQMMNQQAKDLGMSNSQFTDSTGLPSPNLYTTAKDLAILSRALVKDFPQYYHWYKQKWFTYNGIRQPNRNRLLWRDKAIDGLKTGHTDQAGFCMVSSAKHDKMRLIAVVLGSPSEAARADDSQRLLNYGFRFYETHKLYNKKEVISELPVFKGNENKIKVGIKHNLYVTIPSGQYQRLNIRTKIPTELKAPIKKGEQIGKLIVEFDGNTIESTPLYAIESVEPGGFFKRNKDAISLNLKSWFGAN